MYGPIADLPLVVEDYDLLARERDTSSGFTRTTTTVELRGTGVTGRGEDVSYDESDHDAFEAFAADLAGSYTHESFSRMLDEADLWPEPPSREASRHYRRWAFESAALDLALRQAGTNLGDVLGRSYDPVRFVVSTRLPEGADGTPTTDPVDDWLAVDPDLAFKLDPMPAWDDEVIDALAATDVVRVVDLKAHYEDPEVETPVEPSFYRRIVEGFPDALLEDPGITEETRVLLAEQAARLSWDAPITGIESIEGLPWAPRWLNCKPSRFGTVESLLETVAYCEREGISLYGGGQFELGPGRDQVQALASLFSPDGPNDVAPRGYNDPEPSADLPSSPLEPPADPDGLGW